MSTLTDAVMTHLATFERNAGAGGRYDSAAWETFLEDTPCFLHTQAGKEDVQPERTATSDRMRMLIPKGTGVTTNDRVTTVTRSGVEILGGVASVVAPPRDHHDHDELELQLVTGGT